MRIHPVLLCGVAALLVTAANGQVLQGLQRPVGAVGDVVGGVTGPILDPVMERTEGLVGNVRQLANARLNRLGDLVRSNRQALEFDDRGDPAVRGEVIGVDISPSAIESAQKAGFTISSRENIEGLGIGTVVLAVPQGMTLARALKKIRSIAPGEWSANQLHFESGAIAFQAAGVAASTGPASKVRIGIIDGGVAEHPTLTGAIEQRGFARDAPAASAHGTAIASLIAGQGAIRGVLPGSPLVVADVYGRDPAGGNAVAIARALGWMSAKGIPVVNVSLVGPANPLITKVIAAARAKGMSIVAAVGNDGPAAPPAYPASYPGVIAVTGVDGRDRVLVEAGRASHLDYAAPGADMLGAKPGGATIRLRGTSFASPLVAARLAAMPSPSMAMLDREAVDLGKSGPDNVYGRGLICGKCRN